MTGASGAALERVELIDEEHIVPRGTRTIIWLVRVHDAWVPASQVSGATATVPRRWRSGLSTSSSPADLALCA